MPSPLLTAARSTFEALALLFAEPAAPAAPGTIDPRADGHPALAHAVHVAFTGPFDGALLVAVSDDVASALAANMLGLDAAAVAADARVRQDALGELANVVCGNVLPLVGGREAVFHLAAPRPVPVDAVHAATHAPGDASAAPLVEWLDVEGGRAALVLLGAPLGAPPSASGASALPPGATAPLALVS